MTRWCVGWPGWSGRDWWGPCGGLVRIGSWWVLGTLYWGLILGLLVLRRWRHLIVWVVASQLGSILIGLVAIAARRPRPFGVELRTSWGGWAVPSQPVAFLATTL